MSRFSRTILTRGYELDARRRPSLGTFARYFEVVRWEAIRRAGSPLRELFSDGGRLVMRAQWIEALAAVDSLEELEVDVAVAHVGSSSIRFVQCARRAGELVARNESVTVAIDAEKRPRRAPDGVRGLATNEPIREFSRLPARPEEVAASHRAYVRPSDLDSLDHVNHSRYIDFADDAYQHARALGQYGGDVPASGRCVTIEYDRETRSDPRLGAERHLVVHTWLAGAAAFAFELVDPVDGGRVGRAMIEGSHEAPSARLLDRNTRM
jgi:acyl-CoA thioesterase FadM